MARSTATALFFVVIIASLGAFVATVDPLVPGPGAASQAAGAASAGLVVAGAVTAAVVAKVA